MASWTTPVTHSAGDTLAVTDWNGVANNETFLYQAPYASYYNSVATTLTSGTNTQVTLGGTEYSGYGFSVSSNNAVAPLAGSYMTLFSVGFNQTGSNALSLVYQNGTQKAIGSSVPGNSTTGTFSSSGKVLKCNASDTIALYGLQFAGAVGTLTGSNETYLSLAFVGSQ